MSSFLILRIQHHNQCQYFTLQCKRKICLNGVFGKWAPALLNDGVASPLFFPFTSIY